MNIIWQLMTSLDLLWNIILKPLLYVSPMSHTPLLQRGLQIWLHGDAVDAVSQVTDAVDDFALQVLIVSSQLSLLVLCNL